MNRNRLLSSIILITLPVTLSMPAHSADKPWYVGAVAGLSLLSPETQNSPFTLDSGKSIGGGAFVGYDFGKRTSAELAFNYLGSATLSGVNGKTDIGYTSFSASGLMYVYGDIEDIADRYGLAGYVRLGFSSMNNSASIPLDRKDNVAIWAGVGIEWAMNRNMNLRGELATFDGDAQAAQLSVIYRPRNNSTNAALAPVAKISKLSTPVAPKPAPNQATEQTSKQASKQRSARTCTAPVAREPRDAQGCAMFSGIVSDVTFDEGAATLKLSSLPALDHLGENLLRNPAVTIEIQAHTESFGEPALAKEIARQRTITVARYLISRGVPVKQLRARAFGDAKPLTTVNSVAEPARNNRIELLVLR